MFDKLKDPAVRKYIYTVSAIAVPLLIASKVVTTEEAAMWLNVLAAVLGLGTLSLASYNTNVSKK
jgi:hypothetical protein